MLFRLLGLTWRLAWQVDPAAELLVRERRPVVYALWHEAILIGIWAFRGRDITVMVSQSKDGEIISQIIEHLGYATARGSSTRGGGRALLEIARIGLRGGCLAITPDGPRGPRRCLQPGVLLLAQRAGLPIIPLAFGARGAKRLRSWDRMLIPRPFARVAVRVGAPVTLPRDLDPERLLAQWTGPMESTLRSLQEEADRCSGGESTA